MSILRLALLIAFLVSSVLAAPSDSGLATVQTEIQRIASGAAGEACGQAACLTHCALGPTVLVLPLIEAGGRKWASEAPARPAQPGSP